MSDLQPILDLAASQWPWLSKVLIAIGGARLVIKPGGQWLKGFITSAAERASVTLDPEDDTWIESLLRTRAYRVTAFLLDLFVSVKLPAAGDLFASKPTTQ
jgi:hypothetical protein